VNKLKSVANINIKFKEKYDDWNKELMQKKDTIVAREPKKENK
jgi:hypothetical protein